MATAPQTSPNPDPAAVAPKARISVVDLIDRVRTRGKTTDEEHRARCGTLHRPGVPYLYSPTRNLVVPRTGEGGDRLIAENLTPRPGDWCHMMIEEPDPIAVESNMRADLESSVFRNGMTQADVDAAIAAAPQPQLVHSYNVAYRMALLPCIERAKKVAASNGKIQVTVKSLEEMAAQSLAHTIRIEADPLRDAA